MSLPIPEGVELSRVAAPADSAELRLESGPLHCDAIAQSHLQQFVVSLWLHFFQPQNSDATSWKECSPRRRRHFVDAGLHEARDFASYIASHSPATQRDELMAVVHSRLERCNTGQACSPLQNHQIREPREQFAYSAPRTSPHSAQC